jgi:hypothetical protein
MTAHPLAKNFIMPPQEEIDAMTEEEIIELRRRITSSMTKQEWKDLMTRVCEHPATQSLEEYKREQAERKGVRS